MSNLDLTVEIAFGVGIATAAKEMCELAAHLRVNVESSFNGVGLLATPGMTPDTLVRHYDTMSKRSAT